MKTTLSVENVLVYNHPITKGDVVALSRNIEELVAKLDRLQRDNNLYNILG